VRFSGSGFGRTIDCQGSPYSLVRGEDFFNTALTFLEERGVRFFWEGCAVEVSPGGISFDGVTHRFDGVVDAAFRSEGCTAALWQSFGGIRIQTAESMFDEREALLMDLEESSGESPISFIYKLPFSSSEALVEHTTFSFSPRPFDEHLRGVRRWLERQGIGAWRELEREHGAIPMGTRRGALPPWPVIGTAGGGVRAGTGYGFIGIHRQAELLAEALVARSGRIGRWRFDPTPPWLRLGDALFLRALRGYPRRGGELLGTLLERASDRDVIAFLSGSPRIVESVRFMANAPKRLMIGALCR
jgi:lycopene beta-cyclase